MVARPEDVPPPAELAVRSGLARGVAGTLIAAASLAIGAWLAALLGAVMAPTSSGERIGITIAGLAAVAAAAVLQIRAVRARWANAAAAIETARSQARGLVAGVLVLGALELVASASAAVASAAPVSAIARLVFAGAAAALGVGWQRLGIDAALRRRVG